MREVNERSNVIINNFITILLIIVETNHVKFHVKFLFFNFKTNLFLNYIENYIKKTKYLSNINH